MKIPFSPELFPECRGKAEMEFFCGQLIDFQYEICYIAPLKEVNDSKIHYFRRRGGSDERHRFLTSRIFGSAGLLIEVE